MEPLLPAPAEIAQAVDAAAGRRPGSLLLRHATVINVFTLEPWPADVLMAGRLIAAVGPDLPAQAEEVIDLGGRPVIPGLVDAHVHLESSLVEPREYARAAVPRGVTAVVADPHEIANVAGLPGIRYLLAASAGLPLDVFFTASSCVPATALETAGARLGLAEIASLLQHERVVGVAELMNFPGVVAGAPAELGKAALAARAGKVADGHAPLLRGAALQAYAAAGVHSDHEATSREEGLEKLRAGLHLMIREASTARNLAALLPLVTPETADRCLFCTDDRHPHDLQREGGVDHAVRRAVALGLAPALAVRLASLNPARYFRLPRRGAVAPGYFADLAVLPDLHSFQPDLVYKAGRPVARGGELTAPLPPPADDAAVRDTVRLPALTAAHLALPAPAAGPVRAIRLVPGQILTAAATVTPRVVDGQVVADPDQDLAKLACIERHRGSGRVGVGLVQGLGLRHGAIASTVAHDSHNLITAGCADADMLVAARRAAELGGGFVAAAGGQVLAEVPLPVAGLISRAPLAEVVRQLDALEAATRNLGVHGGSPFMTLSFLALAVIPELRLTDHGLVDVLQGAIVPLAAAPP